jgi:hypothetical protein
MPLVDFTWEGLAAWYAQKQVIAIFAQDDELVTVVTVIVRYGRWDPNADRV